MSQINLPALLNDPRLNKRETDFFAKTWGESFEKSIIHPSQYIPSITHDHFQQFLLKTSSVSDFACTFHVLFSLNPFITREGDTRPNSQKLLKRENTMKDHWELRQKWKILMLFQRLAHCYIKIYFYIFIINLFLNLFFLNIMFIHHWKSYYFVVALFNKLWGGH